MGVVVLVLVAAAAAAASAIAPNDPARQHAGMAYAPPMRLRIVHDGGLHRPFFYPLVLENRLERRFRADTSRPVSLKFFANGRLVSAPPDAAWLPLGADPLGRDVFSRTLLGGRLSLAVSAVAVVLTLLVGGLAGALAGFAGGVVDRVITGLADIVIVLPAIYAIMTMRAAMPLVLDTSTIFWTLAAVLAVATWPMPARGVRAIIALERTKPYAEAAYAAGAGPLRILLRHLLPAARGHLAIQGLLLFPAFIFAEATLSYVGLGFAEPSPSWGVMLQDAGRVTAMVEAPWLLAPAAAIVITILAVHLVTRREF